MAGPSMKEDAKTKRLLSEAAFSFHTMHSSVQKARETDIQTDIHTHTYHT